MFLVGGYSLADAFWTILWIFLFVVWFWLLIAIFSDLFRDHELSGWWKALWVIVVIVFPVLGILGYLIFRGQGMAERSISQQQAADTQFRSYVQDVAGGSGTAAELEKLADLHGKGVLSDEEYTAAKAKALG